MNICETTNQINSYIPIIKQCSIKKNIYIYINKSGLRLRKSKSDKMFFENICWVPLTQYDSNN